MTACESSDDDISTMKFEHVKIKTLKEAPTVNLVDQRIVNGRKNCDMSSSCDPKLLEINTTRDINSSMIPIRRWNRRKRNLRKKV